MADKPFQRFRRFLAELKRRNVYQVAATYAVVGFVLIQVADLTFVRLGLPAWTVTLVIVLVAIGFPLALVLAWAFERTPEGMRRTSEGEPPEEAPAETGVQTGYKVLVGLGLIAAAVVGGWYLTGGGGEVGDSSEPGVKTRSIAVLPFSPLSEGEDSETFARGIHDDLLTRLAHIADLTVISRTAVEKYRDSELTTGQIADSLDVRWVMEGGVEILGEQIQVNAQLINPKTEAHAWADSYQRELTTEDLFALQGEITRRIARSLEAQLTAEERQQVERRPTEDLTAYNAFLKGRSHIYDFFTRDGGRTQVDSAITYLRKAIRRDSTFASAHAWLGMAYVPVYVATQEERWRDSAFGSARRAQNLEPNLAEAHMALGLIHWRVASLGEKGHFRPALKHLKRAVDLQPNYARAAGLLGVVHDWMGHDVETVRWFYRATLLAPDDPVYPAGLASILRRAGLLEPAEAWAQEAVERGPGHWRAVRALSLIRAERVGPGAALETLRRFRENNPADPDALEFAASFHLQAGRYDSAGALFLRARKAQRAEQAKASTGDPEEVELGGGRKAQFGYALIELGDTARGRALLQEALASEREGEREQTKGSLAWSAEVSAALGNVEEAYHFLERALEKGYYGELDSPLFESLRGDPRFKRLRARARKKRHATQNKIQKKIRQLDIQLFPDSSVSASPE